VSLNPNDKIQPALVAQNEGMEKEGSGLVPEPSLVSGGVSKPNYVVGIGASAGGLEALERFFQNVPPDTGMAFVIVQHLSPDFKSLMGEVLSRWTRMPIYSVEDQMAISPNSVFLMPPKTEMIISNGRFLLTAREKSDELRLPIDQFLRSLAQDSRDRAIAIILSGTGSDGSRSIRDIHACGGLVLAQSPETAKFDGMPKSAIETDIVDGILPPEEMPGRLLRYIKHSRAEQVEESVVSGMTPIFHLLRESFGIDFSYYKPSTVARRTAHRLQLSNISNLEEYLSVVQDNREELDALYRDLLIGVTSFFRDPEAFLTLENQVLPELLGSRGNIQEIRAWVAGCATGEEAYSMAIVIHEAIRKSGKRIQAKIFATDVHSKSLEIATAGVYSAESVHAVGERRLAEYFTSGQNGYRIKPELRNTVVFARHNITKDAPFTHMDLISCRNLLIYLSPEAQSKALGLFHFGLRTGGTLFLGPSESPGDLSEEFQAIDAHWKIFRKRRDLKLPADRRFPVSGSMILRTLASGTNRDTGFLDVYQQALEATAGTAILINANREIVHTFGNANQYLRLRPGYPSLELLDLLEVDLRMAVGAALHRAAKEKVAVSLNNVHTSLGSHGRLVKVTVIPLPPGRRTGSHAIVQFMEVESPAMPAQTIGKNLNLDQAARDHIQSLEEELRFVRENLQATIEELETSNEELQATNEELLASNEELQSTNEELHSVNEELYTVNAEYQKKIEELTELTYDMNNLLSSTDVHTIFLDEKLCIRRFTPKMAKVFNLIESDIGRSIHGFMHSIRCEGLGQKLTDVLEHRNQYEEEVENSEAETFLMRILPYKGDPHQLGVVLTLVDITILKAAESRFTNAMEVTPNGMLMVCSRGLITQANSELARIFGYEISELIGKPMEMLVVENHRQEHGNLRRDYFRKPYVLRRMGTLPYVWGKHRDGHAIPLDIQVRPIATPHGRQAIASVVDVSRHQQLEESLRQQVVQRDRFLATLSHELRNPMGAILSAASVLREASGKSEDVLRTVNVIQRQASQMALLLDDLLDVARVTQGKINLRLEPVDLISVCHESIEAVQPLISIRQHQLITQFPDHPVWLKADRVRLLQIVENLLTNAIKYTEDRGRISVTILCTPEQQDAPMRAKVVIQDNGRGMSPDFIQSIFDMFVQSDDTLDRSEGGMGVGLTLVHSLVEMHGGTITAASEGPGLGSTFTLELPLTTERPTMPTNEGLACHTQSKRLVYVEDDSDARDMLTVLLRQYGHEIMGVADNGEDGFELIKKYRPDVAILDIGLPKLDGYQLARKVREEFGRSIYLIALTGYGREEDHENIIHSGFDHHLVKPIMIQELHRVVATLPRRQV
jgi:two-component system CheB/CheR fusion protein